MATLNRWEKIGEIRGVEISARCSGFDELGRPRISLATFGPEVPLEVGPARFTEGWEVYTAGIPVGVRVHSSREGAEAEARESTAHGREGMTRFGFLLGEIYPGNGDTPRYAADILRWEYRRRPELLPPDLGVLSPEEDETLRRAEAELKARFEALAPPPRDLYREVEGDMLYRSE
jgi:hypothetical protein